MLMFNEKNIKYHLCPNQGRKFCIIYMTCSTKITDLTHSFKRSLTNVLLLFCVKTEKGHFVPLILILFEFTTLYEHDPVLFLVATSCKNKIFTYVEIC